MRIVAGSAKGVSLGRVPRGIRPVSDRAREGVFSSLGPAVEGAKVLDLYAGTGAMGIEALSRGADGATFVDRSRSALTTVRGNLERTRTADRAEVVPSDVIGFLRNDDRSRGPFDLVFCDPPYELGPPELDDVLQELASGWLPGAPWTVVLTRGTRSSMPVIPLHWTPSRRLRYGDSLVTLIRPRDLEVRWA